MLWVTLIIYAGYFDGSQKNVGNWLNFNLQNFGVTEMGSLRHICERAREIYSADDGSPVMEKLICEEDRRQRGAP